MKPNLFAYLHFLVLFLRLKLLGFTTRLAPLPGGVLDGQTALMRRAQVALGEQFLDQVPLEQARADFRANFKLLRGIGGIFEKVASTREVTIPTPAGGMAARLYLPDGEQGHALFLLLHGGGWVIGDLDTGDNMARFLCRHVPCAVLSVDYRLAPEHPFPAAVEDAAAALAWASEHALELHADPRRVLVGGDSAGGTLTAAIAQGARAAGSPALAGQVLFYAATNCATLDTPSYREFGEKSLGLPRRDVDWFLAQYTPDPHDRLDPRTSPLLAQDLRGLAPALVVTAEFDVLRDEGEDYARRMQAAGVKVTLMRCNGVVHGFLSTVGLIRRATLYFERIAAEVRQMAAL